MDKMIVGKLDTARRQLETAARLFFEFGDPVSIHTLTCAAYNVIRDVNKTRGGTPMFAKELYVKIEGTPSLGSLCGPENFFKHADRDPNQTLIFHPKFTECLLVDACEKYGELTGAYVPELLVFTLWFMCQAPSEFDIPTDWASFIEDANALHAKDDRGDFYNRLIVHLRNLVTG